MTRILSVIFTLAATVAATTVAPSAAFGDTPTAATPRPNVILILADDLALGDLASQNGGKTRTPHLDRLAKASVRFTRAYSASSVCAPARAALLTGRYPHRTGVVTLNMNRFPKWTSLKRDEVTLADVMKANGYATGLIGKWHCGTGADFHPLKRGFETFEGFSGSQDLSYFRYTLDVGGKPVKVTDDYLTDDLSRRAIAFVRRHRDRPFFLKLAHYAPHRPLEAPAELIASYRKMGFDQATATIYAMNEVMDRGIGQLLDELDKLKLAERTVVIFASDNGPDPLTGKRFNLGLRGMKYEVYEGGIRVPCFIRWQGRLKPGTRDQLIHFVDFFPTILELCGIKHAGKLPIDGVSFRAALLDEHAPAGNPASAPTTWPRYWQWNRGRPSYTHNAAMREGPWKLVRPFITRNMKLKPSTRRPVLYNLAQDPSETRDFAAENDKRYTRMLQQLEAWSQAVERDRMRDDRSDR